MIKKCKFKCIIVVCAILLCGCGKDTEDANSPIIEQQIVVIHDETKSKRFNEILMILQRPFKKTAVKSMTK